MNNLIKKNIIFALISFLLLIIIIKWIDYLIKNNYIKMSFSKFIENFDTNSQTIRDMGKSDTSHNVNVPLTTTSTCTNMCGPPNRCSITGQQCFSDIDCPGCQPKIDESKSTITDIPGNNEAGKLGPKLTYSTLTTDIGTQSRIYATNKFDKQPSPNFGTDMWSDKFNQGRKMFDDRYKPSGLKNMPSYPDRYSLSGESVDDGPIAANSYLS